MTQLRRRQQDVVHVAADQTYAAIDALYRAGIDCEIIHTPAVTLLLVERGVGNQVRAVLAPFTQPSLGQRLWAAVRAWLPLGAGR